MTTPDPLDGILFPYSVQVTSSPGSTSMVIPVEQRQGRYSTDVQHWIDPGVYQIMFSYNGPEGVRVNVYSQNQWTRLLDLPAGGSLGRPRTVGPAVFSAIGELLRVTAQLESAASGHYAGAFQIYPLQLIS